MKTYFISYSYYGRRKNSPTIYPGFGSTHALVSIGYSDGPNLLLETLTKIADTHCKASYGYESASTTLLYYRETI